MLDCTSCGHANDADALHCQHPNCDCRHYTVDSADLVKLRHLT